MMEGILSIIGSPLLNIVAEVDQEFLTKYNLKSGSSSQEKELPIYVEEVKKNKFQYVAGGAALNTARVTQWLLGPTRKNYTRFIGCIGNDENGALVRTATEAVGVEECCLVSEQYPTGVCTVLVHEKERCLVTTLGAAAHYTDDHLKSDKMLKVLDDTQVFYTSGYFFTVSPISLQIVAEHSLKNNKIFTYNLAAPFVIEKFYSQLCSLLPYIDIVFSNHVEARIFGEKAGWGSDLKIIAAKLSEWNKLNTQRSRVVIFTHGPKPTIVYQNGKIFEYAVCEVKESDIVDTDGAGDSFVGGFLSRYILSLNNTKENTNNENTIKIIEECINYGHYAASEVIQRVSCQFPEKPKIII